MYVQTEETPNPNTLKFLPGKTVSEVGSIEFTAVKHTENRLIKDILSMKEVNMVFLGMDFITVKKNEVKKNAKEFNKFIENEKSKVNIQRFKGLGEMNPEELWNTTLNPETRNLLQVQYSKDLKKDHDLIHTLMGNDVASRKDFIVENAINVSNLDI